MRLRDTSSLPWDFVILSSYIRSRCSIRFPIPFFPIACGHSTCIPHGVRLFDLAERDITLLFTTLVCSLTLLLLVRLLAVAGEFFEHHCDMY
jgi:hypothetical protein